MQKKRWLDLSLTSSALAVAAWFLLAACAPSSTMRCDSGMMQRHMARLPAEYANLTNPVPATSESATQGRAIYQQNCAACHGETGAGDGPAAASLDPAPAPISHTGQMLSDVYLFYRISEGGDFPPLNSAMPAWKESLSEEERWDVVNYIQQMGGSQMMPGCGMMNMGMGMMLVVWSAFLLLVVGAVLFAAWLVRRIDQGKVEKETPLAILKRRYAAGEIRSEEFESMKRQLEEP